MVRRERLGPAEIGVDQAQELAAAVSSVLDDIVAGVRIDLARREADTTTADLRAALADVVPFRDGVLKAARGTSLSLLVRADAALRGERAPEERSLAKLQAAARGCLGG